MSSPPPLSDSRSLPAVPADPPPSLPPSVSLDSAIPQPAADLDPAPSPPDVDPQILEALRSKDRIYVLKLGELMEGLIVDRRQPRIDLTPSTSYQRLLVHRCSAYYKLVPENDPASKGIFVVATAESRIPARRLCDLVPPESTSAPAFKIMRRSPPDRRSNRTQSQAGSVAGDEGDLSDADPSESGSLGGRSNATGRSNKSRMTIQQREAAYNEARSRIFMDFEEKEKEKDMSASSSSISLASGSTSGGGGSSVSGDPDESVSSPATESEYSAPSREKRESRHLGRNGSASSSSRSVRSGHYNSNQGSSRNSRASSPLPFTYANIYEPNQTTYYDHSQHPSAGYNPSQYMYPYPPPGMPPNAYYSGYPYYQYPYPSPPPHTPHNTSDPSTPSSGDPYSGGMYPHQYAWTPPPHHPMQSPPMPHPPQMPPPGAPPPPMPSQYPYMPPHLPYGYSMPGYYPITAGPPVESPPGHINNQGAYDVPSLNGSAPGQHNGRNASEATSPVNGGKNSHRHNSVSGGKGRNMPGVNQGRGAWSYGPGIGQGGHVITSPTETIGPRLNNTRRTSNNSVASSVTSRSSNCDDVASTASSSTTSSSSRRTYTSTTSSQHPLPARPDWAVGLKPQPTLHPTQPRHRDNSHSNSRTMSPISSPSRNLNGNGHHHNHHNTNNNNTSNSTTQQQQPASLQSPTEFPPLSSGSGVAPEKRMPVVSGAWGNNASRNIRLMSPGQGPQHNAATALVHHPQPAASNGPIAGAPPPVDGVEDSDRAFERPPPKSSAELFNPKLLKRPAPGKQQEKDNQRERERAKGGDVLVEQVEAMSLDGAGVGVESHQPKEALAV